MSLLAEAMRLLRVGSPGEARAWLRSLTPDERAAALAEFDQYEATTRQARAAADAFERESPAEITARLADLPPLGMQLLGYFLAEHVHRWERDPEREARIPVDLAWRCRSCGQAHPNTVTTRWTYVPDEEATP